MNIASNKFGYKIISLLILCIIFFAPSANAVSTAKDYTSQYDALSSKYTAIKDGLGSVTDTEKKSIMVTRMSMLYRQMDVIDSYSNINDRIQALGADDSRKDTAEDSLGDAESPIDAFIILDVSKTDSKGGYEYISSDTYKATSVFNDAEKKAVKAINDVNSYLLAPVRPGQTTDKDGKKQGGVPKGDLIEDFIPGVIRILFRFASLAILISFVVSGVMLVMVFGNEERATKAKHMLYYSLIGFAFVTLAFAIVKAVTDIDFFGFI